MPLQSAPLQINPRTNILAAFAPSLPETDGPFFTLSKRVAWSIDRLQENW
jgi:hypothetical protein